MSTIRRKPHRLSANAYYGQKAIAYTLCVENRKPLFRSERTVRPLIELLGDRMAKAECLVGIYCFMPDHLHVIACGQSDNANSKHAIDAFKRDSGRWIAHPWQGDCYDHIIRRNEDWRRQVAYVLRNPVRGKLVEDPYAYPFTGSIGYDLGELISGH